MGTQNSANANAAANTMGKILTALHLCQTDSVFNFRKTELLCDYPELKQDHTVQYYLQNLERIAKQCPKLSDMFCFAVKGVIETHPTGSYASRELLLCYGKKLGTREAQLALIGLAAYLDKASPLVPIKRSEMLTDNTRSKYKEKYHEGTNPALTELLSGISYLNPAEREEIRRDSLAGLGLAMKVQSLDYGKPPISNLWDWFLPICVGEKHNLGGPSKRSDVGTTICLKFGILIQ